MFRSHVFTCCKWGAIGFGKCDLSDNQNRQTQDKESTSCTLNGIHCNREKIGERLAQLTVVLPGFLYLGPNFQGEGGGGKKWEGQMNISVSAPFHFNIREIEIFLLFPFFIYKVERLQTPPSLLFINLSPLTAFALTLNHSS
jgi:hypothetical protein